MTDTNTQFSMLIYINNSNSVLDIKASIENLSLSFDKLENVHFGIIFNKSVF